jgi:hypothetical protein
VPAAAWLAGCSSHLPDAAKPELTATAALALGSAPDVLTQRFDIERTGVYAQAGFSTSIVSPQQHWGLLGVLPVVGAVYAQPLFVKNQTVNGVSRNVLVIATAKNHVTAFDADSLQRLWDNSLGPPDESDDGPPVQGQPSQGMSPTFYDDAGKANHGIGIQSTPVIDAAQGLLYVSYRTQDPATLSVVQHVAALSLANGAIVGAPHAIQPTELSGNIIGLRQRASLLLLNGVLYVAFGGHVEDPAVFRNDGRYRYRGQILAFDKTSLNMVRAAGNRLLRRPWLREPTERFQRRQRRSRVPSGIRHRRTAAGLRDPEHGRLGRMASHSSDSGIRQLSVGLRDQPIRMA